MENSRKYLVAMPGGRLDDPFDPEEMMSLLDVVRTLSHICRWNGRGQLFYSVLDHSLTLASLVEPEFRLAALVHDFSEAYTGDIPDPVKMMPEFAWFREAERKLDERVFRHYGHFGRLPEAVTVADRNLAMAEAGWLGLAGRWAQKGPENVKFRLNSGPSDFAEFVFENNIEIFGWSNELSWGN